MKIKYATISKTGRRSNNEDCFNVLEMPEHNRFMGIVCDGMGGHSFQKGDRILLCSDGLYKSMAPYILQARMLDEKPLEDILDVFDFLCQKQGDDNYTAILIEIE